MSFNIGNEDEIAQTIDALERIADNTGNTFTEARNVVVVANDEWVDDRVTDVNFDGDLQPGDTETVCRIESFDEAQVAPRAVATTAHPADIDGDNDDENVVEYRFEIKQNRGDEWNVMQGLTTTLPFGDIGKPVQLLPGSFVGPVQGFRIRFHNRSDQFANPTTVPEGAMGGEAHVRIIRE